MNGLILHIPKGFWSDDQRHSFINALPMGVFAIANYCNQRGHRVLVTNAAAFPKRDLALKTILGRIIDTNNQVIGIPLHWHLSGYDIILTAKFLKEHMPGLKVILGGLTASVYPDQLMECCPEIDGIIVGDGELPFCSYLDKIRCSPQDPDFGAVPNLVWRSDDSIIHNEVNYIANSDQLSELDFSPQGTVFSMSEYMNKMRIEEAVSGTVPVSLDQPTRDKLFFISTGRGCSYNCIYCSGSAVANKRYCRRSGVTMRSPDSVVADFQRCYAAGFRRFHIGFDPAFASKDQYYQELFFLLQKKIGSDIQLVFEAYGLPASAFLKSANKTFAWVGIILSPCFFSEAVRKAYKGYYFSNEQLEEKLKEIHLYKNCQGFVYYAVSKLEEWSIESLLKKIDYMRFLKEHYFCEVTALPIYVEPGSPWVSFPKLLNKKVFDFSFQDFLTEWQKPFVGWNDRLTGITGTGLIMQQIHAGIRGEIAQV